MQRTIDRIIFLRMCEDRGLEPYSQLKALLDRKDAYPALLALYRKAEERYNSEPFHRREKKDPHDAPNRLSSRLVVEDKVLKSIIKKLYYPDSPYQFSVLPTEILGYVYEESLGKVIRVGTQRTISIEDKPAGKKAGGAYYTPEAIVAHVVKATLGKALEGKTPRQAAKIRVLDPACGSGSFLLGAFDYLLSWHTFQYLSSTLRTDKQRLYEASDGGWRLTTTEKNRILRNNLFGVDIDPQAVELTKSSLLLKVLERGRQEKRSWQLPLFQEGTLPDLRHNIRCGNALVASDVYDYLGKHADSCGQLNPFDWEKEFSHRAHFDIVIGNPPWGQKGIAETAELKEYTRATYASTTGIYDLFRPFVEKAIQLTRPQGYFGLVLPDIVLLKDYQNTREFLLRNLSLTDIDWWGRTFKKVVIDAVTIIGIYQKPKRSHLINIQIHDEKMPLQHNIPQEDFWHNPRLTFNLLLTPEKRALVERLRASPKLGEYFAPHEGIHSGNIRKELFVDKNVDKTCQPMYFGRDEVAPYSLKWNGRFVRLGAMLTTQTQKRYANIGRPEWYNCPKVLVRRTGDYVLAALDFDGFYASNNFFVVLPAKECSLNLDGLAALLNSSLTTWFFRAIEPRKGRVFAELKIKHLKIFPLPPALLVKSGCSTLNSLGTSRREIAMNALEAKSPDEKRALTRRSSILDQKIEDEIVRLFAITSQEIAIIG